MNPINKKRVTLETYRPDVRRDEDNDGEGTEPGISDGKKNVTRHPRTSEVLERDDHHA